MTALEYIRDKVEQEATCELSPSGIVEFTVKDPRNNERTGIIVEDMSGDLTEGQKKILDYRLMSIRRVWLLDPDSEIFKRTHTVEAGNE